MRQIEKRMLTAIRERKNFHCDNTTVKIDGDNWTVTLYKTDIAKRIGKNIILQAGGFHTRTTQSRLNAILSHFGKGGIWTEKGEWFWTYSGYGETVKFYDGMQFEVSI